MVGTGGYLYLCPFCKREFPNLRKSTNHMMNIHYRLAYVCNHKDHSDVDKKEFAYSKPQKLTEHLRKAHGIGPERKAKRIRMEVKELQKSAKRARITSTNTLNATRTLSVKFGGQKLIEAVCKMVDTGEIPNDIYVPSDPTRHVRRKTRSVLSGDMDETPVSPMQSFVVEDPSKVSYSMDNDDTSERKIQVNDSVVWIDPLNYEYGEYELEAEDGSIVVVTFFPDDMPELEKPIPNSPVPPLDFGEKRTPKLPPGLPLPAEKKEEAATERIHTLNVGDDKYDLETGLLIPGEVMVETPPNELDNFVPNVPTVAGDSEIFLDDMETPTYSAGFPKRDFPTDAIKGGGSEGIVGSPNSRGPAAGPPPAILGMASKVVPGETQQQEFNIGPPTVTLPRASPKGDTPKSEEKVKDISKKDIKDLIQDGSQEDISEVKKRLAQQQVKKNVTYDNGQTLLHLATQHGKLDIVKALLSNGFSVKQKNGDGLYPLMIAAKEGYKDIAHTLLQSKANLQFATEKDKMTPLMFAAQAGKTECIKLFLSHPVPTNKKDILDMKDLQARTPLHIAVEHRQVEATVSLLKADADPNLKDQNGNTVAKLATRNGEIFMRHYRQALEGRTPMPPLVESPRLGRMGSGMKGQWPRSSPRSTPDFFAQRSTLGPVTPRTPAPRTPAPRTPAPRTPISVATGDEKGENDQFEKDPPKHRTLLSQPQLHKYASTGGIRNIGGLGLDPWDNMEMYDRVGLMDVVRDLVPDVDNTQMGPEHFLGYDLHNLANSELSLVEQACTKILIKARDQKLLNMINHVMIKEDNFRGDTQTHLRKLTDDVGTLNACWDKLRRDQEAGRDDSHVD